MKFFIVVATFSCFLCKSIAVQSNIDAVTFVAQKFGIGQGAVQDNGKILNFLQNYVAQRSENGGWKTFPPQKSGMYFVITVKLSAIGDATSYRVKHGAATLEYYSENGTFGNIPCSSLTGVVYSLTDTVYTADYKNQLNIALQGFGKEKIINAINANLAQGDNKANMKAQAACCIVKGTNCGNDIGNFLVLAVSIDNTDKQSEIFIDLTI